jgi:hypothetical protein
MHYPRAISAGPTVTGAVVSLGGRDNVFLIRLASHLQRLRCGAQWVPPPVATKVYVFGDEAA